MATSQPTITALNSINQKKVLLLSRLDGSNLVRFINGIRQAGCKIVLIATALGYNYSLKDKNFDDLGARIQAVYTSVIDPPPVVTITGISQLVPFLEALDPDLVISFYFPYQLTKSFLAHRSIKINGHPSPLPLYRGSDGLPRAILQQLPRWGITWHYIEENYDAGNILIQEFFELRSPYGFYDVIIPSVDLMFGTLGKVIEMSLSGHPGSVQRQPTVDEEQYVNPKPFTIAERTITSGLNCHEVWTLVEACKYFMPALLKVDERLYHVIEARRLEIPLPFTLAAGEIKRMLHRYVQQCTDGQMEYVVRIV
jgi:methionyl-tRNA formyltransferase